MKRPADISPSTCVRRSSVNERNWRVVFGAIALGCTLAVAQPPVQASPILTAILVVVAGVAGFLKAPDDAE